MEKAVVHLTDAVGTFFQIPDLHGPGLQIRPGRGIGRQIPGGVKKAPDAVGVDPEAVSREQTARIDGSQLRHLPEPAGVYRLLLCQKGPEGVGHGHRLLQLHPDGDSGNGQRYGHQDWKILMVMLSALFS